MAAYSTQQEHSSLISHSTVKDKLFVILLSTVVHFSKYKISKWKKLSKKVQI